MAKKQNNINQVLLSGIIISQVKQHPNRLVFTIFNEAGRFYVQYPHAPDGLVIGYGMEVLVRGRLFSVPVNGKDTPRLDALEVILLPPVP